MNAKGRLLLAGKLVTSLLLFASAFLVPAQASSLDQKVEAFFQAIQQEDAETVFEMLAADTNLVRATYYESRKEL